MSSRHVQAAVVLASLVLLLAVSGCVEEDAPPAPTTTASTPVPTATPAMAAVESPSPDAPLRAVSPGDIKYGPCEHGHAPPERHQHFLHWTPDGTHLVFDEGNTVWTLDIENGRLRTIARIYSGDYVPPDGFYADVSPDGSRVVYSTCEFGFFGLPPHLEGYAGRASYELAVVNVDGTDRRRLTETARFDGYPAWSPDGTHVAFAAITLGPHTAFSMRYSPFPTTQLAIMAVETGELRWLDSATRVALHAPVWSPDGQRLAFIAFEGQHDSDDRVLYTIGVDGAELTKVAQLSRSRETTAPPSWSLDGGELTFAAREGEQAVLYAAMPDGTGLREVWRSGPDGPSVPISQVAWSPDGSEILFLSDQVYVVDSDGSGLRFLLRSGSTTRAAWSPDGSRIAVSYQGNAISTVSRDGTDLRPLMKIDDKGRLHALELLPPGPTPVDVTACSGGVVIQVPEENPGLVHDCETLLSIRDRLAGDSELLNWDGSIPIGEWEGVRLSGNPPRVHALLLNMLMGTLPPELGQLTELRTLYLPKNYLSGPVPPELGRLANLVELHLGGNYLSGSIPPELGGLANLQALNLGGNYLSGSIPPELGGLAKLQELNLGGNYLSGSIPPELGGLAKLQELNLGGNYLSGTIPPEMGSLPLLQILDLRVNYLSGSIPPELGGLANLETLIVGGNQLSGCVPGELPELWVRQSGLKRCVE